MTYKMTINEYMKKLVMQAGKCAICGEVPANNRRLSVDHDHETGRVRGLLCINCNHMLGSALESTSVLRSAIEYIECWSATSGPFFDESTAVLSRSLS